MRKLQECEFLRQEKCFRGENKRWALGKLTMEVPFDDDQNVEVKNEIVLTL
jgi:hypothetical protein